MGCDNNKEKLALKKLSQEYMDGRKSGLGLYKLAEKLQVAKSTLFRIATNFPPVASSNNVQIISIEHPENNIENDFSDIESHPAPYTDYHKENEYRKSFRHRSFNDRKNEYAKLCINGVQISFNPLQENIVKNHESDPSISCEVDPSFVPKNQDHLEVKN